jgi:hypothetical protein
MHKDFTEQIKRKISYLPSDHKVQENCVQDFAGKKEQVLRSRKCGASVCVKQLLC